MTLGTYQVSARYASTILRALEPLRDRAKSAEIVVARARSLWRGVRQDLLPWMLAAGVALVTQALGVPAPGPLLAGALAGALLATWRGLGREPRAS